LGLGWNEDNLGHGPAYRFTDPDGHQMEIYYETEWYQAPENLRPALKNQASRYSDRGIGVRRIDHVALLASDVYANRQFMQENLGCRLTEQIIFSDGSEKGAWLAFMNKSYDVTYAEDASGAKGRLHHFTYAVDNREAVLRAADICLEHNVFIETGPHKHAIQQTFFLYVYEPGGNRVEIANAGARLILAPDWKPIVWNEVERKKGQAWGLKTIESFHTHGTPPVE
jgi:catechol 2,3-dioxygenase